MGNNLDPGSVRYNLEEGQSRLYDDNFKNVEDKNSDFQNNMISYFEKNDSMESNKENREQLTNELIDKVSDKVGNTVNNNQSASIVGMFLNGEKIKDDEEFKTRCVNASKVTIVMIAITALCFLLLIKASIIDLFFNLVALVLFILAMTMLNKAEEKGIYLGIAGAVISLLSFNIIKMVFGAVYLLGMVYLLGREKNEEQVANGQEQAQVPEQSNQVLEQQTVDVQQQATMTEQQPVNVQNNEDNNKID